MKKPQKTRISAISKLKRRNLLRLLGGTATVALASCVRRPLVGLPSGAASGATSGAASSAASPAAASAAASTAASLPRCVVKPQQTEGPYFVDAALNRSDIRSDRASGQVKPGVPLNLVIQVFQVGNESSNANANAACRPLSGAIVDVWHCDAAGVYSGVQDPRFDTGGQDFLRGYQTTNSDGIAEFLTIYPGWYPGRAIHIHFKVRVGDASPQRYEFTSQLYFDDAISDQVYTQPPYAAPGQRIQRNRQDGIFQRGGEQLLLQLSQTERGYLGKFELGLAIA